MKVFDYYFYRMYMIYLKRNEFARVTACIIFCELFLTAFFFIFIFTTYYMTGSFFIPGISKHIVCLALLGVPALFGVAVYRHYSKKRIAELQKRYGKSKYNRSISDRSILLVSHIELTVCLVLWFIIANT